MFSRPISQQARKAFEAAVEQQLGLKGLSYEEVTMRHLVNVLVTDVNANVATPTEIKVFEMAADDVRNAAGSAGPSAASLIRRTKKPIIDGSNKIPGALAMGIFGVAARVRLASNPLIATAPASVTLAETIQAALDDSVLVLDQGGSRIYELGGDEFMNYGSGVRVDNVNSAAVNAAITPITQDMVGRELVPCVLGAEQELALSHFWNQPTAWTQPFQILYMHQTLIARKR